MELTDYQRDILIRTALGEAAGEGKDGMAAVLHVILNRANSGQFPSDPADVALQNKQFSTWNKGEGGNNPQKWKESSASYKTAAAALDSVLGAKSDPTGGALYYHAKGITPYWANDVNKNGVVKIGAHRFYPSHPVPKSSIPDVASATDFGPGIPTPMPARPQAVKSDAAWQPPTAAQTAAEQRLTHPDIRRLGFVPLPAPKPLRPSSVARAGVGTPNLAPPTKVQTVRIDPMTNLVMKQQPPQAPTLQSALNAKAGRIASGQERMTPTAPQTVRQSGAIPAITHGVQPAGSVLMAAGVRPAAVDRAFAQMPVPPVPRAPAPTMQETLDEQAFMRRRVPTAPVPRMPMNPTAAMIAARQPRVVQPVQQQAAVPRPRPRPIIAQPQQQAQRPTTGGLLGLLFGGGAPAPQSNNAPHVSAAPVYSSNLQHNPNFGPAPGVHPHLNQFGMFD
jgi:hypothetical protein